ncbi:MAG: S8 family serine peptidase [Sideroxyarcus sp.]|nr:S8 family serine peptidase [Sideroxyarcus sp.]
MSVGLAACGGGGGETARTTRLAAPPNVTAVVGDRYLAIYASADPSATAVNIYWKVGTGVSKANGTKMEVSNDPQMHTGLTNGTEYCYVVTAVAGGTESGDSAEYCATPVAVDTGTDDPLVADQWHLENLAQRGANFSPPGLAGEDIRVRPAWAIAKGEGVRIAIVDNGLEIGHEDLVSNMAANGQSFNYVTYSSDPSEAEDDSDPGNGHGTSCAGIAAARDSNGLGGSGVAPRATLLGFNLLQNYTTLNVINAMGRSTDVSSNSWGSNDNTGLITPSPSGWTTAIESGINNGRGGKGIVYTWAGGNGRLGDANCTTCIDDSNYDGQANYHGVIAVAAVNDRGMQARYAEPGANLWVSAPGGEWCVDNSTGIEHAITTVDRTGALGRNSGSTSGDYSTTDKYTRCMNGTSSATPGVAGVAALMLAANSNLTWRDVKIILAKTARKNDAADVAGWGVTGGTTVYNFNHKYGFGVVNADAAVTAAAGWTNVPAQVIYPPVSPLAATSGTPIPDNNATGVYSDISVTGSGITSIEFVEITFTSSHNYSGDLDITLTSPSGTVSRLATQHKCLSGCIAYNGWRFGSARHLGEVADGTWRLTVKDLDPLATGTFTSWGLKFYGHHP